MSAGQIRRLARFAELSLYTVDEEGRPPSSTPPQGQQSEQPESRPPPQGRHSTAEKLCRPGLPFYSSSIESLATPSPASLLMAPPPNTTGKDGQRRCRETGCLSQAAAAKRELSSIDMLSSSVTGQLFPWRPASPRYNAATYWQEIGLADNKQSSIIASSQSFHVEQQASRIKVTCWKGLPPWNCRPEIADKRTQLNLEQIKV